MSLRQKIDNIKLNRTSLRLLSIVLCLATVCTAFFSVTSYAWTGDLNNAQYLSMASNRQTASDDKTTGNDKYMLITNTGSTAGTNIDFFLVNYKDENGYNHTDTIFPKEAKASALKLSTADFGVYRDSMLSTVMNKNFNKSVVGNSSMPFSAHSLDYYYFSPSFPIGSIVSIKCFGYHVTSDQSADNEWYCNYAKLVLINDVYGRARVGTISRNLIPIISGFVIAEQKESTSYSWTKGSQLMDMKFQNVDKVPISNTFQDIFYCQMDFADIYGAGLEDLYTGIYRSMVTDQLFEQLILTVKYKDAAGYPYEVQIPLVSTYIYEFLCAFKANGCALSEQDWFDGLFRQGDTMGFACFLPFCNTITGFELKNTYSSKDYTQIYESYKGLSNYEHYSDSVSITGVRFYGYNSMKIGFYADRSTILSTFNNKNAKPLWYFMSNTYEGTTIENGKSISRDLTGYENGDTFQVTTTSDSLYLVNITTDDSENAGTLDQLYFTLYYTKESTGNSIATQEKSISDLAKDYYGFWQVKSESMYNVSGSYANWSSVGVEPHYALSVSKGQTISFFMTLSDVGAVEGARIRLDGKDEWQFSSISVYKVRDRGVITTKYNGNKPSYIGSGEIKNDAYTYFYCSYANISSKIKEANLAINKSVKFFTERTVDRTFNNGKTKLAEYSEKELVQANKFLVINFTDGKSGTDETNYGDYLEYMSYEESQQAFGFADSRFTYKVAVQVGNDGNAAAENGNCGSTDNFYFQLVFTNGDTGYVLANTQLYADGFRTGELEEFYISANRDYGDLKSVHIIPESARDDAEPFDKLMISTITVTKIGQAELSTQWVLNVNSWISIDYTDSGAKDSVSGQAGRVESELARTFSVSSSSYAINVMVAITTGVAPDVDGETPDQISGGLKAYINYIDSDGATRICTVDVVKAICDYANLPVANEITIGSSTYNAVDSSIMLNNNQVNRFTVPIDKLKTITSIQFEGFATEPYTWVASDVYFYTIMKEGRLIYSANGEYINTADYKFLCNAQDDLTLTKIKDAKTAISNTSEVTQNQIKVTVVDNSMATEIDTYPLNKDDTMNVYLYMRSNSDSISKYSMKGAVVYTDSLSSNTHQSSIRFNADEANQMFYKTGISASGLTAISSLTVLANAESIFTKAYPEYAVIEHVRSGVILSKSYFYFSNENSNGYQKTAACAENIASEKEAQYLNFMLTDASKSFALLNRVDDIVVSYTYTEKTGSLSHTLKTKNVFLSEVTGITKLEPGSVYTVPFTQEDVYEIKSLTFTAVGKAADKIGIKNAYIANYIVGSEGIKECKDWFSFSKGVSEIKTTPTTMELTNSAKTSVNGNKSVSDILITIKTSDSGAADFNMGTNADIKLNLSYYDYNDNIKTIEYSSIKNYIYSGSTTEGSALKLALLVNNVSSIHSIELTPISSSNDLDPSWGIEEASVECVVGGEKSTPSKKVNQVATRDNPVKINFSDVKISVNAYSYDKETKKNISKVFSSSSVENVNAIVLNANQTLTLTPSIKGSSLGVSCICEKGTTDANLRTDANDAVTISGNSTNMTIDFSTASEGLYYVTVKSKEFSSVYVTIPIKVEVNS